MSNYFEKPNSAHPVSLRSLHLCRTPETVSHKALVFRLLVKGNEDSGNEIGIPGDEFDRMTFPDGKCARACYISLNSSADLKAIVTAWRNCSYIVLWHLPTYPEFNCPP